MSILYLIGMLSWPGGVDSFFNSLLDLVNRGGSVWLWRSLSLRVSVGTRDGLELRAHWSRLNPVKKSTNQIRYYDAIDRALLPVIKKV